MLSLMLFQTATQHSAEGITSAQFMVHAYTSVVVALLGVVAALLSFLQARTASKHAGHVREIATEVNLKLNGRLDELIKLAREASHQHGRLEGIMEERNRRELGMSQ